MYPDRPMRICRIFTALLLAGGMASAQETQEKAADQTPPAAEGTPIVAAPGGVEPGAPPQDKRVFGVLPNYRTIDGTIPFSPISTRRKFIIASKDTFDWPSYILAGAFAGISQVGNSNPSFGQGLKGFGKRYAASVADQDMGNFMTEAIIPSLLHQDPRYFRKVNGSIKGRLGYAATRVLVARTDSGKWTFNASEVLGNGIVASIGNAYYPDERGLTSTLQRMGTQIGTDAISQVLKEFWPDIKRKWLHKNPGE
jgi:hypothetical protein